MKVLSENEVIFSGRTALVTVPLPLLTPGASRAIKFTPRLPERKLQAIHSLAMGDVVRIELLFKKRFWEEIERQDGEAFNDLSFIHCSETPLQTWWTLLPRPSPVLVGWSGGPRATDL